MEYYLALIEEEILLLFSLKSKRLHQKAGLWIAKMRKPFALDTETSSVLQVDLKFIYVIVKVRGNSRGYLFLDAEINSALRIECSTFYSCRVAKLSSSLISPAFVITVNKFMNCAK